MTTSAGDEARRPIVPDERSGVLFPARLERFAANWIAPHPSVSAVVDQYWHVSWDLDEDERLTQRVIDLPAITLTTEEGNVPAPLVVTGVHARAWRRTIFGRGAVFAVRLRPAGLAVLGDLAPSSVADSTVALTPELDASLHEVMSSLASAADPAAKAQRADHVIAGIVARRPPTQSGLLANALLDELRTRLHERTGKALADHFHCSERTIQRAFAETLGRGPKWVSRRIRLQELARLLVARPDDDLAFLAAELNYADHSHLTNDFRTVAGISPDAYRREARSLLPG